MSARLIPPPQLHLHRITQYSQKNTDTTLLRAPSELSVNRTKASVRTVLGGFGVGLESVNKFIHTVVCAPLTV